MDKMEKARAYFASMPKKSRPNPYWVYDWDTDKIRSKLTGEAFDPTRIRSVLYGVRAYFRNVFESFGTEAQVLIVHKNNASFLKAQGIPVLDNGIIPEFAGYPITVMVLPQWNTPCNSVLSESFYQRMIRERQITPIARIHSHHRLDAYQSATDYNTLNSGTLELVLGHIQEDAFQLAYWLDTPGEQTKDKVWKMEGDGSGTYDIYPIKSGCLEKVNS